MRYRDLGAFPSVAVFAPLVVLMLCHENGLNVHAHIGEVIENTDNRVAKLDGDSLRLASAGFLVLVARALKLADSARDAATPIDSRISVAPLLERLRDFRMNERGDLGKAPSRLPPSMRDRVLVDFLCKLVYCPFRFLRFGFINTPSRR